MKISDKPYLTPQDVADMLDVTTDYLRNWRSQGRGPASWREPDPIRYDIESVEEFMQTWQKSNRGRPRKCDQ